MDAVLKNPELSEESAIPNTVVGKDNHSKLFIIFTWLSIFLIYACEFVNLCKPSMEVVTGPILAVCMVFLMFTDYYYVPYAVLFVTLGALGTVFMHRLALYSLLIPLLLLRMVITRFKFSFKISDLALLALGFFHILSLYLFDRSYMYTDKTVYMTAFILWILYLKICERKQPGTVNKMLFALAVSVTVNGTTNLITGNFTKYDDSVRMGLAGLGGGDPNIASTYITLAIGIILCIKSVKLIYKLPMLLILLFSLITTVSISGLLGLVVIVVIYIMFMNKSHKRLLSLLAIVLVGILSLYVFPKLNITSDSKTHQTNYIEYYQEKVSDKLDAVKNRNFDEATTNRTTMSRKNFEFFSQQSTVHQLFGGNSVNPRNDLVSHNSFVDLLLRFGYIGTFIILLLVLYAFVKRVRKSSATDDWVLLMCKCAVFYWSFAASMFAGTDSMLWFGYLLVF